MEKWHKQLIVLIIALLPPCIFALGLGNITLRSALYQPLQAEIGLIDADSVNLQNVKVGLASADEFKRIDLDRPFFLSELKFAIIKDVDGKPLIEITSEQPIKEPYISFLVNLTWPQGDILRQYTVLLDPPSYQVDDSDSEADQTPQAIAETSATNDAPPISSAQIKPTVSKNDQTKLDDTKFFGPITGQENLWYVAQQLKPKSKLSLRDIMLSLYRANPAAFVEGNINKLQQGSMLAIPTNIIDGSRAIPPQAIEPSANVKNSASLLSNNIDTSTTNSIQAVGEEISNSEKSSNINTADQPVDATNSALQQSLSVAPTAASAITSNTPVGTIVPATAPNNQINQVTPIKLQATQSNEMQPVVQPKTVTTQNAQQLQSELEITSQSYDTANQANQLLKLQLQQAEQKNKELQQQLEKSKLTNNSTVSQTAPVTTLTQQPTTKPEKPVSVQMTAQASADEDFISKFTGQLFIGLIIIAALGLFVIWRTILTSKKISNTDTNAKLAEIIQQEQSKLKKSPTLLPTTNDIPEKNIQQINTQAKIDSKKTNSKKSDNDPLQEAEVYINYGRYGQAENVILEATKADPDNPALWETLLKIYAETFNSPDFEKCVLSLPESMVTNEVIRKTIMQLRKSTWKLDGPPPKAENKFEQNFRSSGNVNTLGEQKAPTEATDDNFKELDLTEETEEETQEGVKSTDNNQPVVVTPSPAADTTKAIPGMPVKENIQSPLPIESAEPKNEPIVAAESIEEEIEPIVENEPKENIQDSAASESTMTAEIIPDVTEKTIELPVVKNNVPVKPVQTEHSTDDFMIHELEEHDDWHDTESEIKEKPEVPIKEINLENQAEQIGAVKVLEEKEAKAGSVTNVEDSLELSLDNTQSLKSEPIVIQKDVEHQDNLHFEIKQNDAEVLNINISANDKEQLQDLIKDTAVVAAAEEGKSAEKDGTAILDELDLAVDLGDAAAQNITPQLSEQDKKLVEGIIAIENSGIEVKNTQHVQDEDSKIPEPNLSTEKQSSATKPVNSEEDMDSAIIELVEPKKILKKSPTATDVDSEYSDSTVENSSATKLDLVHAYIEMGDYQAAKKMLLAVIEEGDKKYLAEAKSLLAKLGKNK